MSREETESGPAAMDSDSQSESARPRRRRVATVVAVVFGGALSLSLLATLFAGRLERPFTRVVGRMADFISDHMRVIAVVSVAAFLSVWLFIGLVTLVQWQRDRFAIGRRVHKTR